MTIATDLTARLGIELPIVSAIVTTIKTITTFFMFDDSGQFAS